MKRPAENRTLRNLALGIAIAMMASGGSASFGAGEWFVPWARLDKQLSTAKDDACRRISGRLGSVSLDDCQQAALSHTGVSSIRGVSLLAREFGPSADQRLLGRVLLFGGIHGDELSSVSIVFKWIQLLEKHHSGKFHWKMVPVLNPDGLLQRPAQRVNSNGVDLNRNFPSPNWNEEALAYWDERTAKNPRRYPGAGPLSEPESNWLAQEIERFRPDVIVSVHAPLEVLDFDGPPDPPRRFGPLWLNQLGTYPGSLGRWAGAHLGLPVVTIELPSAGMMPTPAQQEAMWVDLVRWLQTRLPRPTVDPLQLTR